MLTAFCFHMMWCLLTEQSAVFRCTLFAVVNARWTTSSRKLLVLGHQAIKRIERAKRHLIPPVCSLRAIRAYDDLQTFVTEVGQVTQTVTQCYRQTWQVLTAIMHFVVADGTALVSLKIFRIFPQFPSISSLLYGEFHHFYNKCTIVNLSICSVSKLCGW